MIATGLDRLLEDAGRLAGRRYGVLGHAASVTAELVPIHLALTAASGQAPGALFGPEHGFYGVEQDMVAAADGTDSWTGARIRSLYGSSVESLRPDPEAFADLDLLLIDLQDVGSRYYTYAATAVWAAEVALGRGVEVWVLDRPNPLGGEAIEGNLRGPGLDSFVGAFETPVRHGLTLAELVAFGLGSEADRSGLGVWRIGGWNRNRTWAELGRPWVAPSPNMPTPATAWIYPGACLVEATELSEGRGTTRPFELLGSPGTDARALAERLNRTAAAGARFAPVYFRPQFQKHRGRVCAGVRWFVTEPDLLRPYVAGIEILRAFAELATDFAWRAAPYEFVTDQPAIDLLTGSDALRRSLEEGAGLDSWLAGFAADVAEFRERRRPFLLYGDDADAQAARARWL